MTATAALLTGLLLLTALFMSALVAASLRSYSHARLDEICRQRGCESLFFEVMRTAEPVLVAFDVLQQFLALSFVLYCVARGSLLSLDRTGDGTPDWPGFIAAWTGLILTVPVFGNFIPRGLARVTGEAFLVRVWPFVAIVVALMRPFVALSGAIHALLHRLYGLPELKPDDPQRLGEEIHSVVEAGRRLGAIRPLASSMISQILALTDSDVGAVMTPRTRMCCLQSGMSMEEARLAVLEAGHTRMPLIGQSTDDIIGIIYAKDILKFVGASGSNPPPLASICREAFYVPETTSIDRLLDTMNRRRVHLAIVLDEYGGVAGLVTMEDLLEEIVGEIVDEYDEVEVDPIQRHSETVIDVDARVRVDDLIAEFQYDLPTERDYDTIAGFVFSQLFRVPRAGESFEHGNLRFTVQEADPRRILRLRIERDETLQPVGQDEE